MARSRSSLGSRSSTRSAPARAPAPAPARAPAPAPAPVAAPSAVGAPAAAAPSMGGGIMGSIIQGMTFGVGSSLGHRAVDSVLGPRQIEHVNADQQSSSVASAPAINNNMDEVCKFESDEYKRCLQNNNFDINSCANLHTTYTQCRSANHL